ncbi:CHAP domain-containing protein [Streptococcus agalactiae]|nr:CHAP domain-containing protein [Streptococcus agalactiae]OVF15180.1 CHAP domain-containing protein [Streptococcus agalactiae]OVF15415.1 CHAP domain-containing protein [Streptococcus agalactiae]OVF17681.1 CHAP domain-containing protein [Streptococcus agalactiae]OZG39276.1 CHAP domain-containing protein [Streptococcus agalactiae]
MAWGSEPIRYSRRFRQVYLKEGAIISFAGGSHGTWGEYRHVAFVEKVYSDGSFLISETNINNNPDYIFRHITSTDSTMNFAYMTK